MRYTIHRRTERPKTRRRRDYEVVPPDVTDRLNMDALAVLAVIRNETQTTGKCTLPVAQLAEHANIGRAKVRAAIRLAESLGLIAIEETPDRKRVIVNRGVMSRC